MIQVKVIETDVLIIGGGGAACRAAIEAHDAGADVLVILKGTLGHSGCSRYVGTNAAVGPWGDENDTPELAMRDLLAHGGFLGNQKLVKILTEESAARIQELEEWGVDFERNEDGSIAITHAAAHTYPRNLTLKPNGPDPQADGYLPGIAMMDALMAQMDSRGIQVMNDVALVDLLSNDGRIVGATAIDCGANKFIALKAKATILATGTYSHVYSRASTSLEETGDGQAAAFRAGVELIDMENTQFIPSWTGIPPGSAPVNVLGEQFLERYGVTGLETKTKEDVVFAIGTEIREGRATERGTIFIDPTGPENADTKKMPFPPKYVTNLREDGSLYPGFQGESVDLNGGRFESGPLAHTTTGGIRINTQCESSVPGLYAAGGVVGGLYGHARPEGFTVMITLVFGRRAGMFAAQGAKDVGDVRFDDSAIQASFDRVASVVDGLDDEGLEALRSGISATMTKYAWVIKDEAGLTSGLKRIREMANAELQRTKGPQVEASSVDGFAWTKILEVPNLLLCAELMLMGAIERKDSRGAFFRADYPDADNEGWLKNIIHRRSNGQTVMDTVSVDLRYCAPEV